MIDGLDIVQAEYANLGSKWREIDVDGEVAVNAYPCLQVVCWSIAAPAIPCSLALGLYEAGWRYLTNAPPPDECAFIAALAHKYGDGCIIA